MYKYFFSGIIHPERAQVSDHRVSAKGGLMASGDLLNINVRILLNQIAVWVETEREWNTKDLRNVVGYLVRLEMDVVGFICGLVYDVEILRIICPELGIDEVYGVDVPCISERNKNVDVEKRIAEIRPKLRGKDGVYLHRCLHDLVTAMKDPNDAAFYCYRAIESLRHHCIATQGLDPDDKREQWNRLRAIAKCDETATRALERAAQAVRHGEVVIATEDETVGLLKIAWDIAEAYIDNC